MCAGLTITWAGALPILVYVHQKLGRLSRQPFFVGSCCLRVITFNHDHAQRDMHAAIVGDMCIALDKLVGEEAAPCAACLDNRTLSFPTSPTFMHGIPSYINKCPGCKRNKFVGWLRWPLCKAMYMFQANTTPLHIYPTQLVHNHVLPKKGLLSAETTVRMSVVTTCRSG